MDYFSLFGLSIHYQVDSQRLKSRFQDLQRQFHPDNFVFSSKEERLSAIEKSATINRAYQILRDPLNRAEYFLSLKGKNFPEKECIVYDQKFLIQQFSLREKLNEIEKEKDEQRLQLFVRKVKEMYNSYYQKMIKEFDDQAWENAAYTFLKLRFFEKLCHSANIIEEKLLNL